MLQERHPSMADFASIADDSFQVPPQLLLMHACMSLLASYRQQATTHLNDLSVTALSCLPTTSQAGNATALLCAARDALHTPLRLADL